MKSFDFKCPNGHVFNELYRADETIPEELPCEECKKEGVDATMVRVRFYATPGVMLPSNPGSYNQGF
jgi:hypothetical protein